jgi:hypothetical protein
LAQRPRSAGTVAGGGGAARILPASEVCSGTMSAIGEAFIRKLGRPDPAAPSGVQYRDELWDMIHAEIGAGWFADGFLYLFGEGLAELAPCLEAWSFLVPPSDHRMIVGRNAYGAILVLDDFQDPYQERVRVLDPWTVTYDGPSNVMFLNLIGRALPQHELVDFLDDRAYGTWRRENGIARLGLEDVLGLKMPAFLGGELVAENLQLDGIVDYYRTTAPIYAEAFALLRSR